MHGSVQALTFDAATPLNLPHLINPFKHYLWILKTTHSGADMDTALEMARGSLDGDLAWNIGDILQNREAWWVPGKIVEVRERLAGYWKVMPSKRPLERHLAEIYYSSYLQLCRSIVSIVMYNLQNPLLWVVWITA